MKWRTKSGLAPRGGTVNEDGARDRRVPKRVATPPAIFVVAIVVGAIVNKAYGFGSGGGGPWSFGGAAVIVLGVALSFWSIQEFRHAKTSPNPKHRAQALVTEGPYRYSRNPLYMAAAIMHLGFGIAVNMPGIVFALIPALYILRKSVILREESDLEETFGEAYLSYKTRVRRWF
ncbi:MAG: isoprenylcysteine carboxylmethyltransferase family protein [Proteobacteria bacterium]|nr:isoprenylcysteine carboxylmethyltransferase family protein [Pseudomonadota bacterium]